MKSISKLFRSLRVFIAAFVCTLVLFTQAFPAYSAPNYSNSSKSDLTEGVTNLTEIEKKSQEAVLSDPYNMQKQQDETNPGLNVDQGAADKQKMKTPENSKGVQSIEQKIEKALEKAPIIK